MAITATLVDQFSTLQLYPGATVRVYKAGTTELASLFHDPAMTEAADNPQVLTVETSGGFSLGRFSRPVYAAGAYYLDINGMGQTGVQRPSLESFDGEVVSYAVAATRRYNHPRRLIDRFADVINVQDFGEWTTGSDSVSAATNTATLERAVGAAAELGGAIVHIPAGNYLFTTISLPAGVRLMGEGADATTIRSTEDSAVVTLAGTRAGLILLTLDGVSLVSGSIGVYGESADDCTLTDVVIKRFDKGIELKGARDFEWWELHVNDCARGVQLLGDSVAGGGSTGDKMELGRWNGGCIEDCTTNGVFLSYVDRAVEHLALYGVDFRNNTGNAFEVEGARDVKLEDCYFEGNTVNIEVYDDGDTAPDDNKVVGLYFRNSKMSGGQNNLDGLCQDVIFERMEFIDVDWTLSIPQNKILLRDCTEDAQVTVAGDTTKLVRNSAMDIFEVTGVTTDATPLDGLSITLDHGEVLHLVAEVIGNQRNGTNIAIYYIAMGFRRPAATLAYDAQTGNFTAGTIVTGATSGATARIVADSDSGVSGVLSLRSITGTFVDNEIITDTSSGSATVNGTLTVYNATMAVSASLTYDTQAANFTAGQVVTGGTSGSKATIVSDSDSGTSGTLTVNAITGAFANNEALTDPLGGSALCAADLTLTSLSQVLRTAFETDTSWDAYFGVSGGDAVIRVMGAGSQTIEWLVKGHVTRTGG